MGLDIFGPGELHEYYPLQQPLFINRQTFTEVDIWQHYQEKHGHYMDDQKILHFVQQLHQTNYPPKTAGLLKNNKHRRGGTYEQIFHLGKKAYRLIGYLEDYSNIFHVVHCHRRHQYDYK